MNLVVDADRVLADLKELHERHGGPDGARRLAWSEDWLAAREWFRGKLDELDGDHASTATRPATSGPSCPAPTTATAS